MDLPQSSRRSLVTAAYGHARRKDVSCKWALILAAIVGTTVFVALKSSTWYTLSQELYYTNQEPIDIWVPPPIPAHRPNRNAIITSLFTNGSVLSAAVLGHSISRYTNADNLEGSDEVVERCANVDMVLIHLPGVIGDEERRRLEQVGWTLVPVERVYGPMDIAREELRPHFTKFRAFDFTQYDHILMLESDTLVVSSDVYRIFDLDLDFAGVTDQYTNKAFNQPINTGVLYYRPSQELAHFVLSKVNATEYSHPEGEQSLIRTFLKRVTTHLPIEWNVSLKGKAAWRGEWSVLRPRFKILHYTHPKPFLYNERAFVGTIWEDEVALWWRIRREMEDLYGS